MFLAFFVLKPFSIPLVVAHKNSQSRGLQMMEGDRSAAEATRNGKLQMYPRARFGGPGRPNGSQNGGIFKNAAESEAHGR